MTPGVLLSWWASSARAMTWPEIILFWALCLTVVAGVVTIVKFYKGQLVTPVRQDQAEPRESIPATPPAITQALVMIPVPPEEAKARMLRAKQDARASRTQADGLALVAPHDKRTPANIRTHIAAAALNDRIAEGCKEALGAAAYGVTALDMAEDGVTLDEALGLEGKG